MFLEFVGLPGDEPSAFNAELLIVFVEGVEVVPHVTLAGGREVFGEVDDEAFSGSAAWRDLAQVWLHLVKLESMASVLTLRLDHTKTQLSEQVHSIRLTLAANGTTITSNVPSLVRIEELWQEARSQGIKDPETWVAQQLNISRATLFRIKKSLKRGEVSPL